MDYTLRKPCVKCPFRRTAPCPLTETRLVEIASCRGEFPCHETLDYSSGGSSEPHRKCETRSIPGR